MTKTRRSRAKSVSSTIRIRGFCRLQIGETQPDGSKKIVGDSGWFQNTFVNDGRNNYIAGKIGSVAGSKTPTVFQIATQSTAVDATQTSLLGETNIRPTLAAVTVATGTLRMTASWSSTDNTAAITIGSIAVYNTTSAGTMGSGQTFATSQWNSNQDLSATYEWRF